MHKRYFILMFAEMVKTTSYIHTKIEPVNNLIKQESSSEGLKINLSNFIDEILNLKQ